MQKKTSIPVLLFVSANLVAGAQTNFHSSINGAERTFTLKQ
jgi:hypothetical protein